MSLIGLPQSRQHSPKWFRPWSLLVCLSYAMFLVWIDQGAFSSASVMGALPSADFKSGKPGFILSLNLTSIQFSALGAMYTVGLIIASFVFAALAQTFNEMRLLGYGMLIWAGGVLGTGLSDSFGIMLFCRVIAGCGGGSVMTLTFPFIDDVAPAKHKALWFGMLGLTQPVGIAIGYTALGEIAESSDWRSSFYTEAAASVPFVIFCLFAPALKLRMSERAEEVAEESSSLFTQDNMGSSIKMDGKDVVSREEIEETHGFESQLTGRAVSIQQRRGGREDSDSLDTGVMRATVDTVLTEETVDSTNLALKAEDAIASARHVEAEAATGSADKPHSLQIDVSCKNKRLESWITKRWKGIVAIMSHKAWNFNNIGYIPVEFVLMVFSYWGPRITLDLYPKYSSSDIDMYLGVTSLLGGLVGSISGGLLLDKVGSSLTNSFRLSLGAVTIAAVSLWLAFGVRDLPIGIFLALSGIGVLFLAFVNPINYALSMWTIPPVFRPMSQALLNFSQRAGADLYAPTLAGAVNNGLNNWHATICLSVAPLVISMAMYIMGSLSTGNSPDYRKYYEEEEAAAMAAEEATALRSSESVFSDHQTATH